MTIVGVKCALTELVSTCRQHYHRLCDCPTEYVSSCLRSWLIFKFHVCLDVTSDKKHSTGRKGDGLQGCGRYRVEISQEDVTDVNLRLFDLTVSAL